MIPLWDGLSQSEKDFRLSVQSALEEDMLEAGVIKYWNEYDRAPDEAVPEQSLLDSAVRHLIPSYKSWIDAVCASPKAPDWVYPLMAVGAARMADITIRCTIQSWLTARGMRDKEFHTPPTAQTLANAIATTVIQVVGYQQAKTGNYEDWKRQSKFIKSWTPKRCIAFTKKMSKITKLSLKKRQDFGHHMLRIAEQSGVIELRTVRTKSGNRVRSKVYVTFPDSVLRELHSRHHLLETACILYRPMVCPPVPHTKEESGGYLNHWIRKPIVKRFSKNVPASEPSDLVLRGLNALMNTEWRVNEEVLDVMKVMFTNNHQVANLPLYDFESFMYNEPYPKDKDKVAKAKWCQAKEAAWSTWYKGQQARARMLVRLSLADKMKGYGMFYMPWSLDSRGRGYTTCELMSSQGSDLDRALIQWAEPIRRTEEGDRWLKINIANLFDEDKCTEQEKVEWFDATENMLRKISTDPLGTIPDWEDDAPKKNKSFQRLAAIMDYFGDPDWTRTPVNLDASCNGSQHWAAIMGDESVARLTNVLPGPRPQDLYQYVADACTQYSKFTQSEWCNRFLSHWEEGFPRAVTKRSVMCDAYGISFYGIQRYMKLEGHVTWLPKDDQGAGCVELARIIQAGIGNVLIEPNKGKEWLRDVSNIASDLGKYLEYTVPSGFKVIHYYKKQGTRRSLATLFDRKELVFYTYTDDVDPKAAEQGIAPNYIHSLDASHMFCTIDRMLDSGIHQLCMIHDSYGCPAPYVSIMRALIQETFYEMHKPNQLQRFKEDVETSLGIELPFVPERGPLDISQVLHSNYFVA